MASSRKKVIVRTTNRDSNGPILAGYLPLSGIVEEAAAGTVVPVLGLDGRIEPVPYPAVQWVAYVRDFNLGDRTDPERLSRRTFLARPRTEGLWVRLTLAGGEVLEGLAPLDVSLVDGLLEDRGVFLIPPDIRSNTQRLYLPRHAFSAVQVVAVITTPSKGKVAVQGQPMLFPEG